MEFKRLSDVTLVDKAQETANVLIEENGEIKRIAKTQVGGTGFPTAIIKSSDYNYIIGEMQVFPVSENVEVVSEKSEVETKDLAPYEIFECINMTFEEAYETLCNGEILDTIFMYNNNDIPTINHGMVALIPIGMFGEPAIGLIIHDSVQPLLWTVNGISPMPFEES